MLRIAIVGFGPKGLHALERLLDHASTLGPGSGIEIDLFEPHASPGAGPNYDPSQPRYLRMNYSAGLVDMWWHSSGAVPKAARRSLVDWSASIGEPVDADSYPPRALVGRYLSDGFETLLRHAAPWVTVRLRGSSVERLEPNGSRWDIVVSGEAAGTYDEVLVATGHRGGSPYPVEQWLGPDRIPAGTRVGVRGFALTFIDVALALTEGRGGSFAALDHPYRLGYATGPDPVAAIVPYSRSGRPMLAKPDPSVAASVPGLAVIAERGRARLGDLEAPIALHDVQAIVADVAADSLEAAGGSAVATALPAYAELERSLAVGRGLVPPGPDWALGHAWRALYPAIVAQLGGDGLADDDWPAFQRLAAELERVAFGPAPINAAKLLALVDAGVVDLGALVGPRPVVDVVVDAVLAAPGVDGASLTGRLVADGHARVARFRRGLAVAADGSLAPGLAAIGRPTEDAVIGNDTLSRTLHPLADRWARRVVSRCRLAGVA